MEKLLYQIHINDFDHHCLKQSFVLLSKQFKKAVADYPTTKSDHVLLCFLFPFQMSAWKCIQTYRLAEVCICVKR